jgi:hypothetical protein
VDTTRLSPRARVVLQTRGAVRDTAKLSRAAFWYKLYIAATAAAAEQAFERSLLASALSLLDSSVPDALAAVWAATGEAAARDVPFEAAQMRNATCLCGAAALDVLAGTPWFANGSYVATNCTGAQLQHALSAWRVHATMHALQPTGACPRRRCGCAARALRSARRCASGTCAHTGRHKPAG